MANPEHVERLLAGVETWNEWRRENPGVSVDLHWVGFSEANLSKANLSKANLSKANLSKANLSKANLSGANLSGANLECANLSGADLSGADLECADLSGADLRRANLRGADLGGAHLRGADLSEAYLMRAYLMRANLREANLREANLSEANLTCTNLSKVNLREATLNEATLDEATLDEANLSGAFLSRTIFAGIDLRGVLNLDAVWYSGPSIIGIDTLYASGGDIPESFLRGCGVPDSMIEYARSLVTSARPIDYYSCFISYSSKDEALAKRLHADLQAKGVRCWYAPHDLPIGARIRVGIDEAIRLHDKLLLILSKHSVASDWVEKEVETAMEQERRQKRTVLFPIRCDTAVMKIDAGWPADVRRGRNIGDFCKWKQHDQYEEAFKRLLRDLQATPPA